MPWADEPLAIRNPGVMKYWGMALRVALAFGTFGPFCTTALADDQANLLKLLADPTVQQNFINSAVRSAVLVNNPRPSAQFSVTDKIAVYEPLVFDGSGLLVTGAFKRAVNEQGCGTSRILNVLLWVQGAKSIATGALLPGTTRADPVLQKDAAGYAFNTANILASSSVENCQTPYLADTEFIEQESVVLEGAKGPSWRELWTLVWCTKKMQIPMRFIPDRTGTSITVGPNTAIKVFPLDAKTK
jgi:hypothetical protein